VTTFAWYESFTICMYDIIVPRHVVYTNKQRVLRIRLRRFIATNLLYKNWRVTACIIGCVRYYYGIKRHVDVRRPARLLMISLVFELYFRIPLGKMMLKRSIVTSLIRFLHYIIYILFLTLYIILSYSNAYVFI